MFEIIFTFFKPYLVLLTVFLTFPFILQTINTKLLNRRFKRFSISFFSALLVFSYWLLNTMFYNESDVAALLPNQENVSISPEHQSSIDTIHKGSQITTFLFGSVFSVLYLSVVYFVWLVSSLVLRALRGINT